MGGRPDESAPGFAGWHESGGGRVPRVSSAWTLREYLGAFRVRWAIGRDAWALPPGLYAVGSPGADDPVVVTANYRLTFDLVRRALSGRDAWLLVLETHGINVWCAAGKGTFGTEEVVRRVASSGVARFVRHRVLLLPLLSATGVRAREVRRRTGFEARFSAIRAEDLPACLDGGMEATEAMRSLTFTLRERAALAPVELVQGTRTLLPLLALLVAAGAVAAGTLFSGKALLPAGSVLAGILCGAVAVPLLLPWIPGRALAWKGALAGAAAAGGAAFAGLLPPGSVAATALTVPVVSAFQALAFTGSTPYTSPSGVRREIRLAVPPLAAGAVAALAAWGSFLLARGGAPWLP